jgi:hypothetical protein
MYGGKNGHAEMKAKHMEERPRRAKQAGKIAETKKTGRAREEGQCGRFIRNSACTCQHTPLIPLHIYVKLREDYAYIDNKQV